jgi:hypothetical protein
MEVGALTGSLKLVQGHGRLLRSLRFGDDDYHGHVLTVLQTILERDSDNLAAIGEYLDSKYPGPGENVSSGKAATRRIVFSPNVFTVPACDIDLALVAVMMPFDAGLSPVFEAIRGAAEDAGMRCQRVDDFWDDSILVQDIFALIFQSMIVVCDFSGRNPNVFYEAGIAHTLGKHVIPITQSADDIPFDLRHHRYFRYLNNSEGRGALRRALAQRIVTLKGKPGPDGTP